MTRHMCVSCISRPCVCCVHNQSRLFHRRRGAVSVRAAKELHFNRSGETLKRMQAGVDKLATVVGVTLGPKVPISVFTLHHICFAFAEGSPKFFQSMSHAIMPNSMVHRIWQ